MKLAAITNRGSKKDFIDLYFLLERYPIQIVLNFYQRKFPHHDPFFVIRSLAYFDDVDREPDPVASRGKLGLDQGCVAKAVRDFG